MAEDIGENLVGSYLRYVAGCQFVVFNTHFPDEQGEIDVIGLKLGNPREIWLCEVVTHIRGILYGTHGRTVAKIRDKIERARRFADATFPGDTHYYEIWSPKVPKGRLTADFDELERQYSSAELDLHFIINERYTERIQKLVEHARGNSSATSEQAYRLLQILTRLKGTLRV